MPDVILVMIITDQDGAITNVSYHVYPNTLHRFCIWHIETKFSMTLDATIPYYNSNVFRRCIWDFETLEEFDLKWEEVVEQTKTAHNALLKSFFSLRSKWVPIYVKHVFSAGMSSSQRVESVHTFFKRYVSNKNSLFDFINRFEIAIKHLRHSKLQKDHINFNSKPLLRTSLAMEKQLGDIYTHEIF
ncbi:hypothetical protein Dsin_018448 [Dipteronia sinensis]|uniref:Protein FAR1-RELATED SEQUENCE n=1 Tax=Dipteronia sinensis TaxID=43782 RepID=A0AAE0E1M1_9ROSI|nr:hypothetical protein Dsin_018448 [Dipteronia sinensis]